MRGSIRAVCFFAFLTGTGVFAERANAPARDSPQQVNASRPSIARTLTTADVEQALAFGNTGHPAAYELRHRQQPGRARSVTVALVYTPFIRVALAARAAADAGHELTARDLPADLTAPIVHVAFRWYGGVNADLLPEMAAAVAAADYKVAATGDHIGGGAKVQPKLPPPPLWTSLGVSALRSFAGKLPYDDVVLVAAYDVHVLQPDVSFVIFKQWPSPIVPAGMDSLVAEGLVTTDDVSHWR